jgi:hypothetical protein
MPVRPPDSSRCNALVDRLYRWSMKAICDVPNWSIGDGKAVGAILGLNGTIAPHEAPSIVDPPRVEAGGEEIMEAAFKACTASGQGFISITQLMLEAALRGGAGPDFSPERVGRWLAGSGKLRVGAAPVRRRLHGHIVRLYELEGVDTEGLGQSSDPFAFCASKACDECQYHTVCSAVVPGLRDRKSVPK